MNYPKEYRFEKFNEQEYKDKYENELEEFDLEEESKEN